MSPFRLVILASLMTVSVSSAGQLNAVFVGDVLLGREVEHEINLRKGASPWQGLRFDAQDFVIGNLEGAVGDFSDCLNPGDLCFNIHPSRISLLAEAGFTHLGLENNHALDLGPEGRSNTRKILNDAGIGAIHFESSPYFISRGGVVLAVVALNAVGTRPELTEVMRKIRLARQGADWVIVFIHWGAELNPWMSEAQKNLARRMVDAGADVIIGHHPHVIQPVKCVAERPVYFSLGNHLFDQRSPSTHTGLAVSCLFQTDKFKCTQKLSRRSHSSSFPKWTEDRLEHLPCENGKKQSGAIQHSRWRISNSNEGYALVRYEKDFEASRTLGLDLHSFSPFALPDRRTRYFIGHRAYSEFDGKVALRPSVYLVRNGQLVAEWKGSALAYPSEDFEVLDDQGLSFLCAWHSERAYFLNRLTPPERRVMAYAWNGFGFSRDSSPSHWRQCQDWARARGYTATEKNSN